jgi:hypothetical protein
VYGHSLNDPTESDRSVEKEAQLLAPVRRVYEAMGASSCSLAFITSHVPEEVCIHSIAESMKMQELRKTSRALCKRERSREGAM